jgi:hypothetical protein
MQKGDGFDWKIAIKSATAVIVFSPPESWLMTRGSLPGGFARISTPDSSQSVSPLSSGKR